MPVAGAVALIVIVAALTGAAVWAFFARQVRGAAARLDVDTVADPKGVDHALARVERAVQRARADADAMRAAEARLLAALEALPQGVVLFDAKGTVEVRNRAAKRFLGDRTADALLDDAITASLRPALAGERVSQVLELYGPPARRVELTAAPFPGGSGAVVEIEDITDRSRLEAVRTDFVANISHELRTPIGALALLAETLADEDDPDLVRRLSDQMVKEAHRVNRLVEDLLELSRIELGEMLETEHLTVGLVASEAHDRVRPLAEDRDVKVRVGDDARSVTLVGERRQIVSALANLLDNAVRYSEPGSEVEVSARVDGAWVEIAVADHGIGIPAHDLDRVFERFYRVDRARSRETGGTGLGLAIVRHVVHNHGGTVQVESTEGVGSTFTLRLPADHRSEGSPHEPHPPEAE